MNSAVWFEIYVKDMARAKTFYEAVFSTQLQAMSNPQIDEAQIEMWGFDGDMNAYGATGALVKMQGFEPGVGGTIVYFGCEDCAIEEARILENGGSIQQSKFSIGEHGFCSLAMDTEGNMIGLHSMK